MLSLILLPIFYFLLFLRLKMNCNPLLRLDHLTASDHPTSFYGKSQIQSKLFAFTFQGARGWTFYK